MPKSNIDHTTTSIDNIKIEGNTISSKNQDGDIVFSPSGSGKVKIGSQEVSAQGTITPANIGAVVQSDILSFLSMQSTSIDTIPRLFSTGQPSLTSGSMPICFFSPLVTRTISQISMTSGGTTAASGLTLARMGIYTFDDSSGTGTLVAAIASDTTLFTSTGTTYTRSLSTNGGLPSTYTLNAGTRYAFGVLCVGTTMPQIIAQATSAGFANVLSPRASGQRTGQSDLPTSLSSVQAAGTIPYARFS